MYQKLSEKERQQFRDKFRENQIYRILYTPLWRQRGDDLSPVDVWVEANRVASKIKNESDGYESSIIQEIFEELTERYSILVLENGTQITRPYSDAEHSAMMVSTVVFFLLLNIYPDAENHPYKTICKSIYDIITEISGFKKIYEETRRLEDEFESRGEFIEVADFIEQISIREHPLTEGESKYALKVLKDFAYDNRYEDLKTAKDNERMLSRINDNNNGRFIEALEMLRAFIRDKEDNNNATEDLSKLSEEQLKEKIVSLFTSKLLNVNKPNELYFLMLAMWARKLLSNKEIPDFVRKVHDAYPSLLNGTRTEEHVVFSIQNMNKKTNMYFDENVKDQSSMISYIDSLYPKKKNGERRKDAQAAVDLANKLFLALK